MKKIISIGLFVSFITIVIATQNEWKTFFVPDNQQTIIPEDEKVVNNPTIEKDTAYYKKEWKVIDSLNSKGLYESAVKKAEEIKKIALAEKNAAQAYKALNYIISNQKYDVGEEYFIYLDKELKNAFEPYKQFVYLQKAALFKFFFNSRLQSLPKNYEGVEVWNQEKLVEKYLYNIHLGLSNPSLLQSIPVENHYEMVLQYRVPESRKYRATLYDLLVQSVLEDLNNTRFNITQPVESFNINQASYFAPIDQFLQNPITSPDTLDVHYQTLKLMQLLLRANETTKNIDALVDNDLMRLSYLYNKTVIENKNQLYVDALNVLLEKHKNEAVSTRIEFEKAKLLVDWSNLYEYSDTATYKYKKMAQEARLLCQNAIKRYPESFGAKQCGILLQSIERTELNFLTSGVYAPSQPMLFRIDYLNVDKVYVRYFKTDYKMNQEEIEDYKPVNPIVKEFAITNPKDYLRHTTEFYLPGLELGFYIVQISNSPHFEKTKEEIENKNNAIKTATLPLWVTNLNYQYNSEAGELYVFDQTTGMPVKNVVVEFYKKEYKAGYYKYIWLHNGVTNQEGVVSIKELTNNYIIGLKYQKDQYFKTQYLYHRERYREKPEVSYQYSMFLDRAIYRPGQIVYFKGLVNTNEGLNAKIMAGALVKIEVKDANYKIVHTSQIKSNDFGTFSGSYTLPTNGLNGNFTLLANGRYVKNIRVEDYKRPQFEVKMQQPKEQYRVNDSVKVQGSASALGGFAVSNAQVKYSVIRKTNFPWYRMRYTPYINDSQKITDGIATSDEKGNFSIYFKALPNLKVSQQNDPIFNYELQVDVTDLSGETRSATIQIPISYKSLSLTNSLPEQLDLANLPSAVNVYATNLSGESIPTQVKINVNKLYYKNKAFVARPFSPAEFTTISETEFDKNFPHYPYKFENLIENMPVDKTVFTKSINTGKDTIGTKAFFASFEEGYYSLEMEGKDAFGKEVKTIQYIIVTNSAAKKPTLPVVCAMKVQKSSGKIGEKASLLVSTSEKELILTIEEVNDGKIIKRSTVKLSNQNYIFEVPFTKALEKGSVFYNFYVNYKGKSYSSFLRPITINTEKNLNVKLITERNILEPNAKEKWTIAIQNDEKKPVNDAELLVSMYDASLDFFVNHYWNYYPQNNVYYGNSARSSRPFELAYGEEMYHLQLPSYDVIVYEELISSYLRIMLGGVPSRYGDYVIKSDETKQASVISRNTSDEEKEESFDGISNRKEMKKSSNSDDVANLEAPSQTPTENPVEEVATRTNFNETAFFYPAIYANEKGEYEFSFTMPEAITRWNFNAFALTKDLKFGLTSSSVVTQKQLMVNTFSPVFLREKDTLYFSAKITNLTEETVSALSQIQLIDAISGKNITAEVVKEATSKTVSIKKGESVSIKWKTIIPTTSDAITYKITAKTDAHQDGEEKTIPVLKNRMLVTETLPLWVRASQNKSFVFTNLDKINQSNTIQNQSFTLEFTSNPAWYAVQSLPYLIEYPYECSEQTFSRLYANALSKHIVAKNPSIKKVFEIWKNIQPEALASNLEKNQELKAILLEETPWLRNANSESERKRRIALLFDLNTMSNAYESAVRKLKENQLNSGAWPWFKGGKEDVYITRYIVTGIGKLAQLGVNKDPDLQLMAKKAIVYLDEQLKVTYDLLLKNKVDLKTVKPDYYTINYFYMRSFFKDVALSDASRTAYDFYFGQLKKYWLHDNIFMQAQIAVVHHRFGNNDIAKDIMKSVEELSFNSEEMGKYWKAHRGYFWYEAPIETQAALIEAYNEVTPENKNAIEDMKLWLLKNKQTNDWKTTKATSEAIYALLLRGNNMLEIEQYPVISLGDKIIDANKDAAIKPEAGTGYFKVNIPATEVSPKLKNIKIENPNAVPAWGAVYWQYFEDLDKITPSETGLSIDKKLFVERDGARGKELERVTSNTILKVGDRIKVRMEIRVDRNLEYVHIKDMRASAFHPENVLSGYRWQNGIGYYESTRDAATNFFISYLYKGTYVFEYPMRITHEGNFSNGITTIQCMYAPEFASHSEGIRVKVQ